MQIYKGWINFSRIKQFVSAGDASNLRVGHVPGPGRAKPSRRLAPSRPLCPEPRAVHVARSSSTHAENVIHVLVLLYDQHM